MTNNNDFLSQEEIDALLNQAAEDQSNEEQSDIDDYISNIEQDALGEIGNIAFGSSATALSTLLGKKVEITTPVVSMIARNNLADEFPEPHVAVYVNYVEGFQGINLLVIKRKDAQVIADLMLGGDGKVEEKEDLSEIHISAVQEAMNQMMGSAATSMSTIFDRTVNISPPGIDLLDLENNENIVLPNEEVYIKVSFRLMIEELIDSQIMQLITVSFAKELIDGIMSPSKEAAGEAAATTETIAEPIRAVQPAAETDHPSTSSKESSGVYGSKHSSVENAVKVHPVQYPDLAAEEAVTSDNVNLNLLLDIPLKVTVELGRAQKLVREILEFAHGSIIELDKLAGEPVDILVNDKKIAKGEVVVIDENFGVRVTDIISTADRITKIQ